MDQRWRYVAAAALGAALFVAASRVPCLVLASSLPDHDGHAPFGYAQLLPPGSGWVAAAAVGLLAASMIGVRWPAGRAYATVSLTLVCLLLLTFGVTVLMQDGLASGVAAKREGGREL